MYQLHFENANPFNEFQDITLLWTTALVDNVSISFIAAGHEKNGGCALLASLVKQLDDAGNKAVFGIVDWDGSREPEGQLRVLGQHQRHSIENYLFDPVLLGALLLREKSTVLSACAQPNYPLLEGRENYFNLGDFDNERLQRVADGVASALRFSLTELVQVGYVNGCVVQVPKEYLHLRGHDLEERIGGGPKQGDVLKFIKWIRVLKMQLVHRKQSVSAWGR